MISRKSLVTVACLMWGLPVLLFASDEVMARARLDVSGRVLESRTACQQPYNNRCITTYTLQPASGAARTFVYNAGPNDASLQRELPVGTEISKEKWALIYRVNGKIVDDFPIAFYAIIASVGVALLATCAMRLALGLMHSNSTTAGDGGQQG